MSEPKKPDEAEHYHEGEYPGQVVLGNESHVLPECQCPDWWFPEADRAACRAMPHGNGLAHHESCPRFREYV